MHLKGILITFKYKVPQMVHAPPGELTLKMAL